MKRIIKKTIFMLCGIVLLAALFCSACYFVKSVSVEEIDCIAIDVQTGDIAITFFEEDYNFVQVYDQNGEKKFSKRIYDAGGSIHKMKYDNEGFLHVYLGRSGNEVVYDCEGNKISVEAMSEWYEFWYDDWQKEGSSYVKVVDQYMYVYDYAGFFEYVGNPKNKIYVKSADDSVIVIWES